MSVSSELEAKTEDNSVLLRPIPEIDVPDFGTLNRKQVTKDLKENDELNSKIYYQLVILQNCERNELKNWLSEFKLSFVYSFEPIRIQHRWPAGSLSFVYSF